MTTIAMLHPGAMGARIGELLVGAGHRVTWATAGRSPATQARADAAGLDPVPDLAAAVSGADVVISLCPPGAAMAVAGEVADAGFAGTYVDANAVAPRTVRAIAELLPGTVDGSVVGGPPVDADEHPTRLYLAGPRADDVAGMFDDDALEVVVVADAAVGAASAVKVGFAGWTKTTAALLVALRAYARAEGVEDVVVAEWERSLPGIAARSARVEGLAAKAWRFEGELREHAAAFRDRGVPAGFHEAAALVCAELAGLRHATDVSVDDVLDLLAR